MKKFTKLALVSSIALTTNAMAMQAMDDTALSATTGQDGLSIGIGISKIEIEKLLIHDNDGLAPKGKAGEAGFGGTSKAGAIVIKGNGEGKTANHGVVIEANMSDVTNPTKYLLASHNLADLVIDTDAGTGTNGAFINVAAQVAGLEINIGEIGVSASNDMPAADATSIRRGHSDTNYNAILSGLTLKTGKMDANIQLGAAPQGAMIKLNTTMVGGLEIANLGILDNSTKQGTGDGTKGNRAAGQIFIESIKFADANSTDLTLKQDISVIGKEGANNGYIQIISHGGAKDNYVQGIRLGSKTAASIGDMEVQGLQTYYGGNTLQPADYKQGAKITISGH
ncbi:pilus assembly protein FilA [Acinetobacter towneri]|uniref:putative pilus system protein FilA n=1 Tax=Acinetobacter towneri TaxID=202956 RepID=UPI001CE0C14E|nr:DUF6160 family protein [Acinetobacter towneri]MCA4780120.1 pilus assembly protein FilA [Acinetobacter towneri]MCA4785524.1 pilus assembly protein FilA [Acinetobacter towneri]MCA4786517.1 pilus assembly protein FilA [Acinetobacter towneri]MCA4796638.1 pilus assembly protein FilA [Acinetobacter towneri]MCA4801685.1 pilus assembly protein FilA [Acinetobacter towneri]